MKKFLIILAVTGSALSAAAEETVNSSYSGTFWSLVPPLVAIGLALITKEVYSSLFAGILLGALLVTDFALLPTVDSVLTQGVIPAVQATSGIFIFLVTLGVIVTLISRTGAAAAFGRWARSYVKSRTGAGLLTFLLGILIFIDDYFNCLTVGNVMMPVTDSQRISRAKLAFIVDATAAPICMIAPVSSWAAAVSQYADGTEYSGLELFIRSIPYNFYSLLTLVFVVALILLKFDYGPMKNCEKLAMETGDLGAEDDSGTPELPAGGKGGIIDMIIPVAMLIVLCIFALVYNGGILEGKDFIQAFGDTDASVALAWGGLTTLVLSVIYLLFRRVLTFKEMMECVPQGFSAMVPAMLILTFASALKNMTNLLDADVFIHQSMSGSAAGLAQFLPAVIFLIATGLSFSTGTAWGTFAILIPIVTGVFPANDVLLYIGISACLAGSVCGDHCSPISDTTIMSSAGAKCEHLKHVSTQLPYALTVAAVSFAGFLLAGVIRNWFIVFPLTLLLLLGVMLVIRRWNR